MARRQRTHARMAATSGALLLLLLGLLLLASPAPSQSASPGSDGAAFPSSVGRSGGSTLLSSLSQYEVVAVRAPQLDRTHRRSIVLGAQEEQRRARRTLDADQRRQSSYAAYQQREEGEEAPQTRQFSRRVSLSFRTLLGGSGGGGGAHTLSSASGDAPAEFDLELSKMADLFHPSYSQTRQVWRDGKRVHNEENVKELSSVEQCYYRGASVTSTNYLSLSTCRGGFSGFIRRGDEVWMVEPAHLHLPEEKVTMHLKSLAAGKMRVMRTAAPHAAGVNETDWADFDDATPSATTLAAEGASGVDADGANGGTLHAAHLHILYRARDVVSGGEFTCTVGLDEEAKLELARTGRLSPEARRRADGPQAHGREAHTHAHSHAHSHDHAHDGHAHSHSHGVGMSTSAYSTWLAAMDSPLARDTLQRMRDLDDADAATEEEPRERLRRAGIDVSVEAGAETPQSPSFYGEHGFDSSPAFSSDSSSDFGRAMHTHAVTPTQKYVEMLVTNDHARFLLQDAYTEESTAAIVAHIKNTYESTLTFSPRLTVVLIGQITWIQSDPYTVARGECSACIENNGVSVDELLRVWNNWRANPVNVAPYAHDNGQLYSGFPFEVPTLGYAGVGAMCTASISGGIQSMLREEFYNHIIAAHELGHNFGMNHDSTFNACPESGFIMNAVLRDPTPTVFSSCSADYQTNFMSTSHITCLDNVPTKQYGNPVCGNGFVEEGEQCDCGLSGSCQVAKSRDPCCNATTCAFVEGATCSATQGCCQGCRVVPAEESKVCRASAGPCDLPEVCTGRSAVCPTDGGFAAGTACSGQYGPGLCYLNSCLSYLQQCRTAGANFPGAPFDTCVQQSQLNQGAYCSTLWCSSEPGQCTYFRQSGVVVAMADGVPCPNGPGDLRFQCLRGECVNPDTLNVNFVWQAEGWAECTDCTAQQYQNVTCLELATNQTVVSDLCAPSGRPPSSRLCVNEARGCVGDVEEDPDVINLFGYLTLSRRTLIFFTAGMGVAFLVLMGCCYQAVTFQGENEELPGPSVGAEEAAAALKEQDLAQAGHATDATQAAAAQAALDSGKSSGKSSRKKKKKKKQVEPPPPALPQV